jgi:hypothetical protein
MRHWRRTSARLIAGLLLTATATGAQGSAEPPLDSATALVVERIIDGAAADGLPIAPLRAKAIEGARRGASNEMILRVVAGFAVRLRVARAILRSSTSDPELIAVAGALTAGVSKPAAESLVAVVRAQPRPMPVTVPFVVATDLSARGVPADSALAVVQAVLRRNGNETDLWTLRAAVARDIASGGDPLDALMVRSGFSRAHQPTPRSDGTRPPPGTP